MGGGSSTECSCQEGILGMCAPMDPREEQSTTVVAHPPPIYPGAVSTAAFIPSVSTTSDGRVQSSDQGFGGVDDISMSYGNEGVSAPPPQPQSREQSFSQPAERQNDAGITVDDILSNLEGSEEFLYGQVFSQFPGGESGFVGLDSTQMRDFVCTNSAIPMDDLDIELLKIAAPDEGLSQTGFLHLLREFSTADSECLEQFLGMSADGETLASEECRSALLMFATQRLHANFGDDRWDRIFNVVMWDAGTKVGMEQWMKYCKHVGRLVRLLRYSKL